MTELQKKLLEMLTWYHEFCVMYKLRYFAVGGTTLGVMRHQGFIPWDDDIDVGMPRPDYERFKKLAVEKINGKTSYFAEFPSEKKDFVYTYGKLYDTQTTLIENTRYRTKRGIFIDIFPIDGLGNNKNESLRWFRKLDFLNKIHSSCVCEIRKGRKWYKNIAIFFCRLIPDRIVDHCKIAKFVDNLSKRYGFDDHTFVGNVSGNWHEREVTERILWGKPILSPFETTEIFIQEKADRYLEVIYGDWKQLPPKEKRITHHDYLELDLNLPYISTK